MTGCRVLVVENETLIAMDIEATLQAVGCEIVGPTGRLKNSAATGERRDARRRT
jgi:AmiR/NasT family two-component response regulator